MQRTFFAWAALLNFHVSIAQDSTRLPSKIAIVNVTVTDMKLKPRKGEIVLLRGETSGRFLSGISDAAGKFSLELPAGDTYVVLLKNLGDTTSYTKITVPVLQEDEVFSEPFWVKIKYEPARKYTLDNVHFDFGKASLRPDSYSELQELADYLQRHTEIKVEIAGHTDNVGNDADNLKLSQQRANAIRDYLVKKGINTNRVTPKGYGATQPIAGNETDEGRQLNRRTEVRIL